MSLWQRLFGRRGATSATTPTRRQGGDGRGAGLPRPYRPPPGSPQADEELLVTATRRAGLLDERPLRSDPAWSAALERLFDGGHESQAIALGGALASALPQDGALQLLVAGYLLKQGRDADARPLLMRVLSAPREPLPTVLAARARLAELARRSGDPDGAMAQLAEILAEDWRYPGAQERLRALGGFQRRAALADRPGADPLLSGAAGPVRDAPTLLAAADRRGARYRLVRELGTGSTGTVYLAHDDALALDVALKIFHPRLTARLEAAGAEPMRRVLDEARVLAAVRHPGVVALYDLDGDARFMAMELCRGGTLRRRLGAGPLTLPAVLARGAELFDTLAAVHAAGAVHGDLKPENLLFRGRAATRRALPAGERPLGDLVVSDFGLARLRALESEGEGAGAGEPGPAGTFGYLPPERFHGAPPSAAADVYAAGAVLIESLLGELPLSREEKLRGVGLGSVLSPARLRSAVAVPTGDALCALLFALVAADPSARPEAAAAAARLQALS